MMRRVLAVLACWMLLLVGPGAPIASAEPYRPQGASAEARSHQLTVSWLVFTNDGYGGAIDNYHITVIPIGGKPQFKFSTTSPVTFYGLRHGKYLYYVAAHNPDGWGLPSPDRYINVPSEPDRMRVPHASTVVGDTLTVTWVPPGSDGLSPITGYQVKFDGDVYDVPATYLKKTFNAPGGTKHSMQVRAGNFWGWGEFSGTHTETAVGSPGPVPSITATATDTTVHVTWEPPTMTGGRGIGYYVVQLTRGSSTQEKNGTFQAEFTGLIPDAQYHVHVTPVGYDPVDGMGELLGPSKSIGVRTKPAAVTTVPTTSTPAATKKTSSKAPAKTTSKARATTAKSKTPTPTTTSPATTDTTRSATRSPSSTTPASTTPDSPDTTSSESISGPINTTPPEGVAEAGAQPEVASPATVIGPPTHSQSPAPAWLWWVLGAGALVAAAVGTALYLRRRTPG